MLFRHKKTGKMYRHLAHGTDCTNSRDGTGVVVYCPDDNEHSIFVREVWEFHEKFESIIGEVEPSNVKWTAILQGFSDS